MMAAAKPRRRRDHGDGSIYQLPDGGWAASVELPRTPDGKRRRRVVKARTKELVKARLAEARAEAADGIDRVGAPRTVAELLTWWLDDYLPAREADGAIRPATLDTYRSSSRRLIAPHLGRLELARLDPADLERWLLKLAATTSERTGRPLSPAQRRQAFVALSGCLSLAEKRRWIGRNPCRLVTGPPDSPPVQDDVTLEQRRTFLDAIEGERLAAVGHLLFGIGCRIGEALALRWEDLDLDAEPPVVRIEATVRAIKGRGVVRGKTKNAAGMRTVPLPARVAAELRRHRRAQAEERLQLGPAWRDEGWVFATTIGTAPDPQNVGAWWRRMALKAGLPTTRTHAARHTVASRLLEAGEAVEAVAAILGDTPATISRVYARVSMDHKRRALTALEALG